MNKEELQKRYPNGIPDDLQEGVSYFETLSQKSGVRSVRLMSNFGKDMEQSLLNNTNVYKGLIVQVASNYELSETDRAWFHPELSKARSLYDGKRKLSKDIELGETNSLVGTYSTYSVDEVGGQKINNYTIVDTAVAALPESTVNHWIVTRARLKDAYVDYKTNKNEGKTLQQAGQSLRDETGGTPTLTNEYISLYKGANSYHFYNHVIKSNGEALVLQSALIGYSRQSASGDIASDALKGFMKINELSDAHRNRIYKDCSWSSSSLINTQVMRMGDTVKGESYRMVKAVFSPNNITGLLDAATTLQLTPTRANIPKGVACDEYTERDIIPFALKEETIHKVMKNHWRTLISSKFIRGDKFLLPRSIVENSLV
jgi:hypothetical protein